MVFHIYEVIFWGFSCYEYKKQIYFWQLVSECFRWSDIRLSDPFTKSWPQYRNDCLFAICLESKKLLVKTTTNVKHPNDSFLSQINLFLWQNYKYNNSIPTHKIFFKNEGIVLKKEIFRFKKWFRGRKKEIFLVWKR